jgi:hypothetical protein
MTNCEILQSVQFKKKFKFKKCQIPSISELLHYWSILVLKLSPFQSLLSQFQLSLIISLQRNGNEKHSIGSCTHIVRLMGDMFGHMDRDKDLKTARKSGFM